MGAHLVAASILQSMGTGAGTSTSTTAARRGGRARRKQGQPQQRQQPAEEGAEGSLQDRVEAFSTAYADEMAASPPGSAPLLELPEEAEGVLWEVMRRVRGRGTWVASGGLYSIGGERVYRASLCMHRDY